MRHARNKLQPLLEQRPAVHQGAPDRCVVERHEGIERLLIGITVLVAVIDRKHVEPFHIRMMKDDVFNDEQNEIDRRRE